MDIYTPSIHRTFLRPRLLTKACLTTTRLQLTLHSIQSMGGRMTWLHIKPAMPEVDPCTRIITSQFGCTSSCSSILFRITRKWMRAINLATNIMHFIKACSSWAIYSQEKIRLQVGNSSDEGLVEISSSARSANRRIRRRPYVVGAESVYWEVDRLS